MANEKKTLTESYTIPYQEQKRLKIIQKKFDSIEPKLKKSEIVRIGIYNVERLSEDKVKQVLEKNLGRLTVGKPKKETLVSETKNIEIKVSNSQWKEIIKVLQKSKNNEGRPQINYRKVINGILFIFKFNKQSRNVPKSFGSYATCRRRLKEWRKNDLWEKICRALITEASTAEKKDLEGILLRTWLAKIN